MMNVRNLMAFVAPTDLNQTFGIPVHVVLCLVVIAHAKRIMEGAAIVELNEDVTFSVQK